MLTNWERANTIWVEWAENETLRLRWAFAIDANPAPTYLVFIDGSFFTATTETSTVLPRQPAGRAVRVDVLATSEAAELEDFTTAVFAPARGGRIKITVPEVSLPANPDFDCYVLYWSDDGTNPTTELTRLIGANNTVYITDVLTEDINYKFRAKLADIHGNLSSYGAIATMAVNVAPSAPGDTVATYSQSPRTAVVTAATPGDVTGIVGYELLTNMLPAVGLQDGLVDDPIAYVPVGSTITATTYELSEGTWKFAWLSVDAAGLRSRGAEARLELLKSGGNLVAQSARPVKPTWLDAVSGAGTIIATVRAAALVQSYTDLVLGANPVNVSSVTRPFIAGDVGRVLYIDGGTGVNAAGYTIDSILAGVATLSEAAGTAAATGGTGTLTTSNVVLYVDGVEAGSAAMSESVEEYEIETAALVNGQTYSVTATVENDGAESETTETVSVTVDGAAPTGSADVTLELVD